MVTVRRCVELRALLETLLCSECIMRAARFSRFLLLDVVCRVARSILRLDGIELKL